MTGLRLTPSATGDPIRHVATCMAEAKREHRLRFDQAWRLALDTLPPRPRRTGGRVEYDAAIVALRVTRGAWKRAYRGEEPLPGELAAATLAMLLAGEAPSESLLLAA